VLTSGTAKTPYSTVEAKLTSKAQLNGAALQRATELRSKGLT